LYAASVLQTTVIGKIISTNVSMFTFYQQQKFENTSIKHWSKWAI